MNFTQDWTSTNASIWLNVMRDWIGKPNLRFIEIGVYEGRSTVWFLENILTDPTSHILCIDPFDPAAMQNQFAGVNPDYPLYFRENVKTYGSRVMVYQGASQTMLSEIPILSFAPVDAVYIDGSHFAADVLSDAVRTWSFVKPGGIVIFDDYLWTAPDQIERHAPRLGIDAFLSVHADQLKTEHKSWQVIVRKMI